MAKRGNPVEQVGKRTVLSQQVVHPTGDSSNTDKGNPAKLRVKQNKAATLNQKVVNPSVGAAREGADIPKGGSGR